MISPPTRTDEGGASRPSGYSLVVIEGLVTTRVPLHEGRPVFVGRSPEADIVLGDARCSRLHARVQMNGDTPFVTDLRSHNGTRVNGRLIGHVPFGLKVGDAIDIGGCILVVRTDSTTLPARRPDAPAPPPPSKARESILQWHAGGVRHAVADARMIQTIHHVRRLAATRMPVLVLGETGVGKEGIARLVHDASPRAEGPFVVFSCAAVPEDLVESELFGHERGAFTGAVRAKPGLIELADRGTLFLDEVGELSPRAQATLLRVLETGRLRRVGDVNEREVDFRVVAATHRDLEQRAADGLFRSDLLFRLSGAVVQVPPLRERPRDVPLLARIFLGAGPGTNSKAIAPATLQALTRYGWPGNVRELKYAIDYALAQSEGGTLLPEHLPARVLEPPPEPAMKPLPAAAPTPPATAAEKARRPLADELEQLEAQRIREALEACHGNKSRAAKLLDMPRRTFFARLRKLGIVSGGSPDAED